MAVKAVLSMMPLGPTTKSRNCLPSNTSVASAAASFPVVLLAPLLPAQPGCDYPCVMMRSVKHNALRDGEGEGMLGERWWGGKRSNFTGLKLYTVALHKQSLLNPISKGY